MSGFAQIEARLFDGRALIKTMDQESATGAVWCFDDGRTARANLCEKLLSDGVLRALSDGLFADTAQTFALAPYAGSLEQFITERHGPNWTVAKRTTKKLREEYQTIILPREFAASKREWEARHALAQ